MQSGKTIHPAPILIQFDQPQTLEWYWDRRVCANARFVFDVPFRIEPHDALELTNGCWYLLTEGLRIPMHGKWDR